MNCIRECSPTCYAVIADEVTAMSANREQCLLDVSILSMK